MSQLFFQDDYYSRYGWLLTKSMARAAFLVYEPEPVWNIFFRA